jgi:peptidoglycan hydrolase-like protein with peptidoglycan-binding domain
VIAGLVLAALVAAVGVAALLISSGSASLSADSQALAKVDMPLGGGKIQSVTVVSGPHAARIPVVVRGNQIWPRRTVRAHQLVTIDVVVKRPGWNAWFAGKTQHLRLNMYTPSTRLLAHYLTVPAGAPLRLHFSQPVAVYSTGAIGHLKRHVLPSPQNTITLARTAAAGSLAIAAVARAGGTSAAATISWFPNGAAAAAVAVPAPGSSILPGTPITLTFNKPVSQALHSDRPPVSPATPGTWHTLNSHTIIFRPEGYGYGLGSKVTIPLPSGVRLVGSSSPSAGTWTVPAGSPMRVQQLLAILGYLPLNFHYKHGGVGLDPQSQEAAAIHPPAGSFDWRYGNVPSGLRSEWAPGASGPMTKGAVMAFENDHGMTPDGTAGPAVWKALINAAVTHHVSTFGYTYVNVNMGSPETLTLWHSGKNVLTVDVNTGIPSAPTATGTYPVFEHTPVTTMSGTNPDGSHYSDPGIPWVSYFNGGDALHGFQRGSYGSPQSLGCVEMTYADAGRVYPYTPIGTLVHVE